MADRISVSIDGNERSSDRAYNLVRAIDKDHRFEFKGFDSLPVDVRFEIPNFALNMELKEPADLASSVLSGHLTKQVIAMHDCFEPGCIVCLGTVEQALKSISKINQRGRKKRESIEQDKARVRSFCADSYAWNIPVFFWDYQPMLWLLSHAYNALLEGDVMSHLPKGNTKAVPVAMLSAIPSIGSVTARAILDSLGPFQRLPWPEVKLEDIQEIKNIGPARARKVCEVFGE